VEETGVPRENHRHVATLVAIGTDCIDSCESNYHTIKTIRGPV
jgi:hypothetical protein